MVEPMATMRLCYDGDMDMQRRSPTRSQVASSIAFLASVRAARRYDMRAEQDELMDDEQPHEGMEALMHDFGEDG